jgi:hypothetical protein
MEVNSIRLLLRPPVKQLPYWLCTNRGEEPLSCRIPGRSSSLKPGQACTFQMKQSTPSALQMYCSHFKNFRASTDASIKYHKGIALGNSPFLSTRPASVHLHLLVRRTDSVVFTPQDKGQAHVDRNPNDPGRFGT